MHFNTVTINNQGSKLHCWHSMDLRKDFFDQIKKGNSIKRCKMIGFVVAGLPKLLSWVGFSPTTAILLNQNLNLKIESENMTIDVPSHNS